MLIHGGQSGDPLLAGSNPRILGAKPAINNINLF